MHYTVHYSNVGFKSTGEKSAVVDETSKSFPALRKVGKDVLAIPASYAESKNAFLNAERVVDDRRLIFIDESMKITLPVRSY